MKKLQRRFNNSHCFTLYDMFEVGPILISKQPNETCITVGDTLYRSKIYIDLLFPSSSTCKLGDEPMAKNLAIGTTRAEQIPLRLFLRTEYRDL